MFDLALLLQETGRRQEALRWYERAAERGDEDAAGEAARLHAACGDESTPSVLRTPLRTSLNDQVSAGPRIDDQELSSRPASIHAEHMPIDHVNRPEEARAGGRTHHVPGGGSP
ncbi:hypothetical protein HS048_21665 [Planomonospora sp. ID91781]|uniref:hypothetical protein n=1 Tax=Planomonospora sp. ID91781 TaxID=2738135 RepID=UPI0018C3CB20|nr:hypothetical protein [Planomonospora sp. ID91781]MBG0823341.1 hypothetical protein [Planomonospora sp. ID91781]